MRIAVAREIDAGEPRVAATPETVKKFKALGADIAVARGAGIASGIPDADYEAAGASVGDNVAKDADIVLKVRRPAPNELSGYKKGALIVAIMDPYGNEAALKQMADAGIVAFAMELMPRITRAQSMDALSAMATIAGYRAVLLGASHLPKMFPLLMTAAGTLTPAKVFVLGAGVAGLQAIATARRLGAVVCAYDVRPAVKEQVESVGAKFVSLEVDAKGSEDKGGYAKAMDEAFYRRQRELMGAVLREQDVVIATAAVPGRKAPILITGDMLTGMAPGSVIVDLAAERGGNCELTRPGETVVHNGITLLGPLNVPSMVPQHASQMFASNIAAFIKLLVRDGAVVIDRDDEIIRETLVTHGGQVVHPRVLELV
jgi:H+-translocating NAD(P) transhydrogenase subunit alpha